MMKLWEVYRFEFAYQIRRPWPWLCMAVLAVFAMMSTRVAIVPVTLPEDFILNSPFIIASVTVFSCQIWLLIAPGVSGDAAARDVHTGLYPLVYTSPVSKAQYLGGRFLAAFSLHALILLAVQVGSLLAVYGPGANPELVGPFRPAAYATAYGYIALSNALIATAFQFAAALLSGRPMASYAGSLALFFLSYPVTMTLYMSGLGERALIADPIGTLAIMNEMMSNWTIVEKNVRMFALEAGMVWNRLLWIGIAVATFALLYLRFRFAHRTAPAFWTRVTRRFVRRAPAPEMPAAHPAPSIPRVHKSFGVDVRARQVGAIAWSSFRMIGSSPAGLFLLAAYPAFAVLVVMTGTAQWGIPLLPGSGYILQKYLTSPLTLFTDYRVIVPLVIVYLAGELVWRERDARINENLDATPVPEWVVFVGKYLGLALLLAVMMAGLTAAGVVSQTLRGHYDYQIGLYLQILFGLQLVEYLLFAVLALLVHTALDQKYVAMLGGFVAYICIAFSSQLGIEHNLLVYGVGPAWSYTDLRGFGPTLGPWSWFKMYWVAWALLLAVGATLLWTRGAESGFRARVRLARRRFTGRMVGAAAIAAGLVVSLGGFIFYNTNVLNDYVSSDRAVERSAEYERRYGRYEGIPQPERTATKLHIEIHPDRRAATIRGSHRLVNRAGVPIDSVHLEPAPGATTRMTFDRPARVAVADDELSHFIYALDQPLQPGDSLTLEFDVEIEPRGFTNDGASMAIVENGSYFTSGALPIVGYQPGRELWSAEDRRKHGLPRQITLPPPGDIDPNLSAGAPATFEAVVGTAPNQVAVAPGRLRRTWNEAGRRYFHYVSEVPISGQETFFSADYAVHRERRNGVEIQVFLNPERTEHLERLLRSARASLDYFSAQFGAYPYPFLQIVEQPGNFLGMGVDGSGVVTGGEGFFLMDPQGDGFDGMFEILAHEMGHQWWGVQVTPALAEGGGIISESLAWYSGMRLVQHVKGREALRHFMSFMRQPSPWPPMRTGLPLLRAMDPWASYRKGPYAMYALSEYVGEDRVNGALRRLVEKNANTLVTTLDLYRELQAVTPDSLQGLLHGLFEVDTYWTFDTERATARQTEAGTWEVTLDVEAHKVVADSAGVETEVPMEEWVEIGVFAAAEPGENLGRPLHVQKHPIRSGAQTIRVTVGEEPARAGIDPYNLLDWEEGDNIEPVEVTDETDGA